MKRKHLFTLALLPLCLASCGGQGYVGTYSFQLGKNSGAHASMSMILSNEDYVEEGKTLGKKMSAEGVVQAGPASSDSSEAISDSSSTGDEDIFNLILKDGISLSGYYNIGDDRPNGRKRLRLCFGLESILGSEIPMQLFDEDLIELFVYAEVDARRIYLRVPVSLEDLVYQLYWYGEDFTILIDPPKLDDLFDESTSTIESASYESYSEEASSEEISSQEATSSSAASEPVAHEIGSLPTQEDVDEINKTYPLTHNGAKYRAFYTISFSLTRQ